MEEKRKLTSEERVKLIRKGNQLFNEGKIEEAAKIFWLTDYSDGLIRVGDYLMYDEKKPFQALLYYKKAHYQKKIDEIYARMIWALEKMINSDKSNKKE
ncbi:MAG TPA: hypothetical protein PKW55_06050 [Spirochaetota bacterium]|nr:hypothetical protein [Spirochaetota bacterium]HOM38445.1 hypothetical protein [Spirochaetota bacterium]HPQ48985.1 hypothetical protein [Spirochaetota bacterium]